MLIAACVLVFPLALMALALGMGWLEQRVSMDGLQHGLDLALAGQDADAVEAYVTSGFARTLEHYWSRQPTTTAR